MKRIIFLFLLIASAHGASAQKFAYVDKDYILSKLPDYRSAQKQLDEISNKWEQEIKNMYTEIEQMYKDYKAEEVLLTSVQRKEKEDAILQKEQEVKKLQQDRFGYEGELFRKRQELIKPIQDRVYNAIQKVAKENGYDFIFDKSSDLIMLYSNPRYDRSDEVLEELGVVINENEDKK